MNDDATYNGWTNYETWAVRRWIDNDHGTHLAMREMADGRCRDGLDVPVSILMSRYRSVPTVRELQDVAYDLAKDVESYVEDMRENLLPDSFRATLFCDLLNAAISEVDWREIATSYVTEWVDEQLDECRRSL